MALKNIHVLLAIDSHSEFLEQAITKIKNIFPMDDIFLCNFNSGEEPKKLPNIAEKCNVGYKTFLLPKVQKNRLTCPEILAMLKISSYFYDLSYSRVYLLHGDLEIIGDYDEVFRNYETSNWSAIAPLINFLYPLSSYELENLWLTNKSLNSQIIEKFSPARLTQSCVIFNKKYIDEIKDNFNSLENFFEVEFKLSSCYGDCSLFDCNHFGFNVSPVLIPVSFEKKWLDKYSGTLLKKQFENVKYIHIGN